MAREIKLRKNNGERGCHHQQLRGERLTQDRSGVLEEAMLGGQSGGYPGRPFLSIRGNH